MTAADYALCNGCIGCDHGRAACGPFEEPPAPRVWAEESGAEVAARIEERAEAEDRGRGINDEAET